MDHETWMKLNGYVSIYLRAGRELVTGANFRLMQGQDLRDEYLSGYA